MPIFFGKNSLYRQIIRDGQSRIVERHMEKLIAIIYLSVKIMVGGKYLAR